MNPIQMLPRHEAEELMLLQRRLKYLTSQYEYGDEAYMYVTHLKDVSTFNDFIEQLAKLQS